MRFRYGPLPDVEDFRPCGGRVWSKVEEPSFWTLQAIGLLVTACMAVPVWLLFAGSCGPDPGAAEVLEQSILVMGIGLPLCLPVHELLHMFVHPGAGRRNGSVLGFWPDTFSFYAAWTGEWSRERFIVCLLAPAVVITCGLFLLQLHAPSSAVTALACFHLLACAVDVVGVLILLFKVPAGARIRNKGWDTYWRPGTVEGVVGGR